MHDADRGRAASRDGAGLRIGIVRARFNDALTARIAAACASELTALGVASGDVQQVDVAGALEIGIVMQAMAASSRFDALIAAGCVIRGETYHFELVANESGAAITRVGLDHRIAIANAVLTCHDEAQADTRADEKGRDAARVAVETARLLQQLGVVTATPAGAAAA